MLTDWFGSLETAAVGAGDAVGSRSSSSSSSSQAAASAALLAVVFARSLVQLVDAMEAAGPDVYFNSLLGRPVFRMRWLNNPAIIGQVFCTQQLVPYGEEDQHNAEVQWQVWQLRVLQAMQYLWAAFKSVGVAPFTKVAAQPAAAAASTSAAAASETLAGDAHVDPHERSKSSSNNSGSSAGQQVKWGYLLRLQQCSSQWAAAVAAYEANQPDWEEVQAGTLPRGAAAVEQHSQQYADAVCRPVQGTGSGSTTASCMQQP
jgi:hypothetical protein